MALPSHEGPPKPVTALCALLLASACAADRDLRAGVGGSFLPNIGFFVSGEQVVRRTDRTTSAFEADITIQFLDDESFASDGNPSAGDWSQIRAGWKMIYDENERRGWTSGLGFVWFRATGEPNIIDDPGDYFGAYAKIGFESRATENWSYGPELSAMFAGGEGGGAFVFVPQLTWGVRWAP